ncbi:alpha/beta hydrolase [Trinickia sp. NRRL B-1857]|uniref:RBBP9/YdeN family alpha/beta hydrolase n=1 Tax=Trinickia sp. NRRL B-1857 TaxID=3162879 RepID=UPI003D292802
MTFPSPPALLIVPGLRDHVADHWQTHLERQIPGARSVPPLEHDKLSCAARVDALEAALAAIAGPVVLAAHSAGVMIVAHWARQYRRPIVGALLATPADLETPLPAGYPTYEQLDRHGWLPTPRTPLPFPSIVAASTNDPLGRFERIEALASAWGSRFIDVGAVGHLNPASGYGSWADAQILLADLLSNDGMHPASQTLDAPNP